MYFYGLLRLVVTELCYLDVNSVITFFSQEKPQFYNLKQQAFKIESAVLYKFLFLTLGKCFAILSNLPQFVPVSFSLNQVPFCLPSLFLPHSPPFVQNVGREKSFCELSFLLRQILH